MNRNDCFARTRLWIKQAVKKHCPTILEDTCLFGVSLNLVTVTLAMVLDVASNLPLFTCGAHSEKKPSLTLPIIYLGLFAIIGELSILFECLKMKTGRLVLIMLHILFLFSIAVPVFGLWLPVGHETTFGVALPNSAADSMDSTEQAHYRKPQEDHDCVFKDLRIQLNSVGISSVLSWVFFVCLFICYQVKKFGLSQPTPLSDPASANDRNHLYGVVLPGGSRQPGEHLGAVVIGADGQPSAHLELMVVGTSCRPTEHLELVVIDSNRQRLRLRGSHLLEVNLPVSLPTEGQPGSEQPPIFSPPPTSQLSGQDPSYVTARERVSSISSRPGEVGKPLAGQRAREGSTLSGVSGLSSDSGRRDSDLPPRPPRLCRYDENTDRCSLCSKLQLRRREEEEISDNLPLLTPQLNPIQGRGLPRPQECWNCKFKFDYSES